MTIAPERLPAHSESPRAVEALIREARRRQHRRYSAIIGAVFLVVGAAVLASGGWGTSKPSVHGGGQTGGNSLVIPSKLQLHAEMVAGLFPTSAADFTKGEQFISLVNALQVQRRAACLTRAGFPSTIRVISPGTGIGDNTEFPDTSRISARGLNSGSQQLGGADLVSTGDEVTTQNVHRFLEDKASCGKVAAAVFDPLESGNAAALSTAWQSEVIPKIDESLAFQTALVGWSACMQQSGIPVTTTDEFFNYADRESQRESSAVMEQLGKLFGKCMAPAESLRVRLRQSARWVFLADHEAQVTKLSALVNRLVR